MTSTCKQFGLLLAVSPGFLCLALAGLSGEKTKNQAFQGNVVPLKEVLAASGIQLDADAAAHWLALVADDGKVYPLIKDAGSRMFFSDDRLLRRPMRLTGRIVTGSNLLQVINVHSLVKGKLHEVYYWCEVCTIKRFQAGICECCGDKMEFREAPVK